MKKRLITGICLVLYFLPFILFDKLFIGTITLFSILSLIATNELLKLYYKNNKRSYAIDSVIFLLSIIVFLSISQPFLLNYSLFENKINYSISQYNKLYLLIPFTLFIFLLILLYFLKFSKSDIFILLNATFYPSIGFGAFLFLRILGVKYILFVLFITILTDTFAYLTGMLIGKHKLIPSVSPKKTIEGSIGGTLIASIVTIPVFHFYKYIFKNNNILENIFNNTGGNLFDFSYKFITLDKYKSFLLLFGVVILLSIIAQIGDLYASYIKRRYNVKDYSNIFPGHGGVLDRFDSVIFISISFLFILLIL